MALILDEEYDPAAVQRRVGRGLVSPRGEQLHAGSGSNSPNDPGRQAVAGLPNAPLKTNRGFKDASPAIEGLLDGPVGVATYAGKSLTAANYLFVVDTNNNRISTIKSGLRNDKVAHILNK